MSPQSKKAYLEAIRLRYRRAKKHLKSKILDEFCLVCSYHRKHAIRQLNRPYRRAKPKIKNRGCKPKYNPDRILKPLSRIWLGTDQMCSKKLKAAIPLWLPFYEEEYETLETDVKLQLLAISAPTIDRMLKSVKVKYKRKGLSGTKPGKLLKNQIPIRTGTWDINQPGFCEADTVAHCGDSIAGEFIWSLTLTDIKTGWTENRATWNKGSDCVVKQIKNIEEKLPFPLLGFDCDNGSEFLNYHLIRYFSDRPKSRMVQFTRSRPYHKNDNAHVEQKNWTHVRQLFGYHRFEKKELVDIMNDLYSKEWSLLQNHFIPIMQLAKKEKINSKYYKRYDKPSTPYQRLLNTDCLTPEAEDKLIQLHEQLNPFKLKKCIENKLKVIFKLVTVIPKPKNSI